MATGKLYKTPENIERFVTMLILGCSRLDIQAEIGIKKATYYDWLGDKNIIAEIDSRRAEIKDEGLAFIKGRYKKYLENIDKICDDYTDKRTCLAANQFMVEKMDGKNTSKVEVKNDDGQGEHVDPLQDLDEEIANLTLVK
jgi:hypothetical protein